MEKEREYKKITVNSEWIKKNTLKPGWQRNIYSSRVNHFINHIKNGTFKSSLVTVAQKGKKLVILDGQHKLEAISRSEASIEMDFCTYKDLDDNEMIEIYRILNNVKQPRLIDDIKIHIGKKEWLDKYMEESFPINISFNGGVNSIRIDRFLNILSNGYHKDLVRKNLTRKGIDSFIDSLDQTTYLVMADFCRFYKECFGEPSRENWLYKNVVMFTIFRIWRENKDHFDIKTMLRAFRPIEKNDSIRRESNTAYDLSGMEMLTRKIYNVINYRRTANKFLIFWEEEMLVEL